MNDEPARDSDEPVRDSRVPFWVMGVLGLALVIGAAAFGKKEKKAEENPAARTEVARAVVVPSDRPRTLIVAPCDAPLEQTVTDASAGQPTELASVFRLPAGPGQGVRTVLVPHCAEGAATAGGRAPSAAIVLASRADDAGAQEAQSRVLLPVGSDLTTIVVPRCAKPGVRGDSVLGPHEDDPDLAVARPC